MSNKVKVTVFGHHNSDYRQTTFRFVDKGSLHANYAQALKLAIRREAQWTGWYDNELRGREKVVAEFIDKLFKPDTIDGETIIFGYDQGKEDQPEKVSEHVGLAVWFVKSEDTTSGYNVGFGMAYNQERKVRVNDSDKYENRWISLS